MAQIWLGAMMLDFLGLRDVHDAILRAIEQALEPSSGAPRTPDIGGTAKTADFGRAIAELIQRERAILRLRGARGRMPLAS